MNEIISIKGIEGYEKDGTVYLKLETVARGLGFTRIAASGNEVIRWERVNGYLEEFGVPSCGHGDFIPENIFYRLAMKAKSETAEQFQAFVADEVLPSIRKRGAYLTPAKIEEVLLNPDTIIQLAQALKEEQEARRIADAKIEADRPKVLFADAVSTSKQSILVGDLAKLIKQNGVEIGQNRLFDWLRNHGYLIKQKGASWNMPTQKAMDLGLFEIKETTRVQSDGHIKIDKTVKVTGKGQVYFINRFLGKRETSEAC